MRQAELCDWALDPALFTSLCDSLNRFFTQRGMITSGNNSPLALGAPHSLQVPPYTVNTPPTLASLTHPSPLPYPPVIPPTSGVPRRPLHIQGQGLQRPQLTQPGKTWTAHSFQPVMTSHIQAFYLLPCHHRHIVPPCFSLSWGAFSGPTTASAIKESAQQQRGDPG